MTRTFTGFTGVTAFGMGVSYRRQTIELAYEAARVLEAWGVRYRDRIIVSTKPMKDAYVLTRVPTIFTINHYKVGNHEFTLCRRELRRLFGTVRLPRLYVRIKKEAL